MDGHFKFPDWSTNLVKKKTIKKKHSIDLEPNGNRGQTDSKFIVFFSIFRYFFVGYKKQKERKWRLYRLIGASSAYAAADWR